MLPLLNSKKKELNKVELKNGFVFDGRKIYVQSMLNEPVNSFEANIEQALKLEAAGCEILRVALLNVNDVELIKCLKNKIKIPLVADVHFNYKIALAAVEAGVDKIRINPGNLGDEQQIRQVALACEQAKVPIRIGINGGSLEKQVLSQEFGCVADAMVASALKNINLLEKFNFSQIVVSMKSSSVVQTVQAYRALRKKCLYPFHLGVTEAGVLKSSLVKSSIGIGSLLIDGIGETIRVTITGDPIEEVRAGHDILKALGLEKTGVEVIACPTCGRTKIDIIKIANLVEDKTKFLKTPIKVAIMGCVVNGPGEAKGADLAIAGGDGCAILFKKGKACGRILESEIVEVLLDEILKLSGGV